MMILMLIAGVGCLLAGLVAIGFGIPVKEFSFGNTLIVTGVIGACAGLIILGMSAVLRELKNIAGRPGSGLPSNLAETATQPTSAAIAGEESGFLFSGDQSAGAHPVGVEASLPSTAPSSAPWLDAAASRDRASSEASATPEPVEIPPSPKPRRNLMFSSTSRRERERAQAARAAEQPAADPRAATATAAVSEPSEAPPAFEDTWPKSERSRFIDTAQRRGGRAPSTFGEASAGAPGDDRVQPPAGNEGKPSVTVLKSGVVDGMAYSLYSDGSIEAQMPEGMMRFASIDELRAHLDQRS